MRVIAIEEHFLTPFYREKVAANEYRNFYLTSRGQQMGHDIIEENLDLGASRLQAFRRVTLPLSAPGIVAAFLFVFIPTLGEFVTPSLVGGASGYMYGNQIVDLFGTGFPDWETGSVLAIFLLGVVAVLTIVFARFLQVRQVTAD